MVTSDIKVSRAVSVSRPEYGYGGLGLINITGGNALVSVNKVTLCQARLVLGWVTVSRVQLPVWENLSRYISNHPGQLSLDIPQWAGAMTTSQKAVMLCSWGVKAGIARVWVACETV